jgi:signal transduction histidine kinase
LYWLAHRVPKKFRSVHDKTKAMSAHIDATIQTVRRIATELRPGILDDLGLVAAIEWQAQEFQKRTGIECVVSSDLKEAILDQDLNTAFFRIFQETLTNIIRHAQATRVEVQLRQEESTLVLEVKDNGRGISESELNDTRSIGVLGMRERAALLQGELQISGVAGQGTTVAVHIPLARRGQTNQREHEDSYRRRPRHSAAWLETDTGRRV